MGEALKDLAPLPNEVKEPVREIEKVETARAGKPATTL